MNLFPVTPESLEKGAKILQNGGLVAFPTETVYGLGADAFNPKALAKVFEVKGRPHFDPLIIHIAAIEDLEKTAKLSLLSDETRKKLFLLAENLWPGPLSIVLPKNDKIPGIATSGLPTAAIRFPDNETAQKLISLCGTAVAAPSANPFGGLSPTRAEHVLKGLGQKVDLILDGGSTRLGLESTVLDITGNKIKILRPGGTPKEKIEKLIGALETAQNEEPKTVTYATHSVPIAPDNTMKKRFLTPLSPGMLKSHYAPKTPLSVYSRKEMINLPAKAKTAYLFFDGAARDAWISNKANETDEADETSFILTLSETGDLTEAASRFFETLHRIDALGVSAIYAQAAPAQGLGEAINDRLNRASFNRE